VPFSITFVFIGLHVRERPHCFDSGKRMAVNFKKLYIAKRARTTPGLLKGLLEERLLLALGAVVGASPSHYDALDRLAALDTRLAATLIDAVFELEKPANSLGIDVVRNG
jgi:hypothetical protein